MEIVDLWKPLPPMEDNKELIRRDLEKAWPLIFHILLLVLMT